MAACSFVNFFASLHSLFILSPSVPHTGTMVIHGKFCSRSKSLGASSGSITERFIPYRLRVVKVVPIVFSMRFIAIVKYYGLKRL